MKNGPTVLPSRSPDLTPLDLCVRDVKECAYTPPPISHSLHELKIRIRDSYDSVNKQLLTDVCSENDYHFDVCRIISGLILK
jgi:hypothetical protein